MLDRQETHAPEKIAFESAGGSRVYRLPMEAFPGFWVYAYLVRSGAEWVLIDTGSGFGESNRHLEEGLAWAAAEEGDAISLSGLSQVLITHAHIDHFGGLAFLQTESRARVAVHELDLRVLSSYEERLQVVARRLETFLTEAGVNKDRRQALLEMYLMSKSLFHSVSVDHVLRGKRAQFGPFEVLHVPGHSPGHVVLRLDDLLFTGDHVLAGISPHQSPEQLTLSTGLGHYLDSLRRLERHVDGIRLGLGGHKRVVDDMPARIRAIVELHEERLEAVRNHLASPGTIADVSTALFGAVEGYNALLAIEEAGAHVEYLYQRGQLAIDNLPELKKHSGPIPLRYRLLGSPSRS